MFEMLSNNKDNVFTFPQTIAIVAFVGGVYTGVVGYVFSGNSGVLPCSIIFGAGGFLFLVWLCISEKKATKKGSDPLTNNVFYTDRRDILEKALF